MKILVHNDGKGKWQSFRAQYSPTFSALIEPGYGKTEDEAVEELKANYKKHLAELNSLESVVEVEYVAWDNTPLRDYNPKKYT